MLIYIFFNTYIYSGIDSTADLKPNQFKKKSFNAIHIGSVKETVKASFEPNTNLCD